MEIDTDTVENSVGIPKNLNTVELVHDDLSTCVTRTEQFEASKHKIMIRR